MDFVTNIFSAVGGINFTVIFQLLCLALIVISGPVVIFLLYVVAIFKKTFIFDLFVILLFWFYQGAVLLAAVEEKLKNILIDD
jgi:hypothetical protein